MCSRLCARLYVLVCSLSILFMRPKAIPALHLSDCDSAPPLVYRVPTKRLPSSSSPSSTFRRASRLLCEFWSRLPAVPPSANQKLSVSARTGQKVGRRQARTVALGCSPSQTQSPSCLARSPRPLDYVRMRWEFSGDSAPADLWQESLSKSVQWLLDVNMLKRESVEPTASRTRVGWNARHVTGPMRAPRNPSK